MKIKINAGLASILELTPDELDVMFGLIEAVDRQCLPPGRRDEASGLWFPNGNLTVSISDAQRSALQTLGSRIRDIYNS